MSHSDPNTNRDKKDAGFYAYLVAMLGVTLGIVSLASFKAAQGDKYAITFLAALISQHLYKCVSGFFQGLNRFKFDNEIAAAKKSYDKVIKALENDPSPEATYLLVQARKIRSGLRINDNVTSEDLRSAKHALNTTFGKIKKP